MVLDNLAHQYAGHVAVISIYTNGGSPPFYNSTAYQKITSYPPPYWWNGTWYFATPWLWVDGDNTPAYLTSTWNSYVNQRLQVSSDLEIEITGNVHNNSLEMQVEINNNGADPISGKLHCVLTEDGVQWSAPNGQQIHNHVPRIWWPDKNGMSLTISAGSGTTVPVNLTMQPTWNLDSLTVIAFLQSTTMQPDSTIEVYQGAAVNATDIPTGIADTRSEIVQDYKLFQNYPNPFNPSTQISYQLPENSEVELIIYDQLGKPVRNLVNKTQPAGFYEVQWNGRDEAGNEVASGIYIYQIRAGDIVQSRKMILLK